MTEQKIVFAVVHWLLAYLGLILVIPLIGASPVLEILPIKDRTH